MKSFFFNINGLVETVYDSPFYWMCSDQDYAEIAFRNRGKFTESFFI